MNNRLFVFVLCFTWISCESISACTSFCFPANANQIYFGNTLDWHQGEGLLVVNKRGVSKTAIWFSNPAQWTSQYGSVTINQWGREFPSRGMNEAGLCVGEMTLSETHFPAPDSRKVISLLQWIQYQLDNCATIDEVIETNTKIRIDQGEYTSHFLVADSTGHCVSMEWLNGQLVYHAYGTLPVAVLTNCTYASGLTYYQSGQSGSDSDFSSFARFSRVASMIDLYSPAFGQPLDHAWNILESVKNGNFTKWRLLFDIKNRQFNLKTDIHPNIRFVDLSDFDFSCDSPVEIYNLADTSFRGCSRLFYRI